MEICQTILGKIHDFDNTYGNMEYIKRDGSPLIVRYEISVIQQLTSMRFFYLNEANGL